MGKEKKARRRAMAENEAGMLASVQSVEAIAPEPEVVVEPEPVKEVREESDKYAEGW